MNDSHFNELLEAFKESSSTGILKQLVAIWPYVSDPNSAEIKLRELLLSAARNRNIEHVKILSERIGIDRTMLATDVKAPAIGPRTSSAQPDTLALSPQMTGSEAGNTFPSLRVQLFQALLESPIDKTKADLILQAMRNILDDNTLNEEDQELFQEIFENLQHDFLSAVVFLFENDSDIRRNGINPSYDPDFFESLNKEVFASLRNMDVKVNACLEIFSYFGLNKEVGYDVMRAYLGLGKTTCPDYSRNHVLTKLFLLAAVVYEEAQQRDGVLVPPQEYVMKIIRDMSEAHPEVLQTFLKTHYKEVAVKLGLVDVSSADLPNKADVIRNILQRSGVALEARVLISTIVEGESAMGGVRSTATTFTYADDKREARHLSSGSADESKNWSKQI